MDLPENTIPGAKPTYYDAQTLRELLPWEYAARVAEDWRADHDGEWPEVRRLARLADVSVGTAHKGLKSARGKHT